MRVKTLLNRTHKLQSFVYEKIRMVERNGQPALEVDLRPRSGSMGICSGCGEVVDFSGYDISPLEQRLTRETGFEIEGHLLEFIGRCQNCRQNA